MSADNQRTPQGREPSTDKKVGGEYEEQEFPGKGSSSTQGNQQGQGQKGPGQQGQQGQWGKQGQQGSFSKQNPQGKQGSMEEETDVEGRDRTRDKFSGEQE